MSDSKQSDARSDGSRSNHPQRKARVTIALDAGQSVTITGCEPSVEGLLTTLEAAAQLVRKGRQLNVSLKTLLAMWKDQRANSH